MAQPGLLVVIKHLKKSRHGAWMMPRTRLASDSLSYLRAGWSAASGRIDGVRPRDCRGDQSLDLSGAQVAQAAAAFQPCHLAGCPFHAQPKAEGMVRGDRTDGADAGIGLPVNGCRSPDGDRPGGAVTVPCRGCSEWGPCPGLSKCTARLILAEGEKRGRFTAPGGWQQHTPPIADYPLAGVTLRSGRLDQARLHSAALQPGPAECGREHRQGAVLMASR
jgi:hypothetical protein